MALVIMVVDYRVDRRPSEMRDCGAVVIDEMEVDGIGWEGTEGRRVVIEEQVARRELECIEKIEKFRTEGKVGAWDAKEGDRARAGGGQIGVQERRGEGVEVCCAKSDGRQGRRRGVARTGRFVSDGNWDCGNRLGLGGDQQRAAARLEELFQEVLAGRHRWS